MDRVKKVRHFEDLEIFQMARELANQVYRTSKRHPFAKDYSLGDQIRRAAVSVMANIAEGFERGAKGEFIHFLYIAKSSCGEVRSHLLFAHDQQYLKQPEFDSLRASCLKLSMKISNLITYLKASGLKGPKFKPVSPSKTSTGPSSNF